MWCMSQGKGPCQDSWKKGAGRWAGLKKNCWSHSQDAHRVVISSSSCVCVWTTEGRGHLLCLRICVCVCVEVMCCGGVCVWLGGCGVLHQTDRKVGGWSNLSNCFFSGMNWPSLSLPWRVKALVVASIVGSINVPVLANQCRMLLKHWQLQLGCFGAKHFLFSSSSKFSITILWWNYKTRSELF